MQESGPVSSSRNGDSLSSIKSTLEEYLSGIAYADGGSLTLGCPHSVTDDCGIAVVISFGGEIQTLLPTDPQ